MSEAFYVCTLLLALSWVEGGKNKDPCYLPGNLFSLYLMKFFMKSEAILKNCNRFLLHLDFYSSV